MSADAWDIGIKIDFSNPCAQSYVDSIADLYASWGVDFLKFDSVTPGSGFTDGSLDARDDVAAWSQALERHNIWLELSWAVDINNVEQWQDQANGWRVDWDVECYCQGEALTVWSSIDRLFPRMADWWRHGGPGGWNDLDSLNVGNGSMDGLTRDERRTAATFWAVSAAPFYIGNDMTRLDDYGLSLLTNPEVIGVNQAGVPAQPVSGDPDLEVWYSLNADSSYTVALFNRGRTDADVEVDWADIGLDAGSAQVRDLWSQEEPGFVRRRLRRRGRADPRCPPDQGHAGAQLADHRERRRPARGLRGRVGAQRELRGPRGHAAAARHRLGLVGGRARRGARGAVGRGGYPHDDPEQQQPGHRLHGRLEPEHRPGVR